ncbi:MAG TPA: hypothetical protein VNH18_02955 [Bryobacteraceae bacterium]|nr:hypothetical protein [Bryobacteraceae bacterium]
MSRKTVSSILLVLSALLALAAAGTVLPWSSFMVSDLGYYTLCPFAPYSTLALLFLAGLGWVVRKHINSLPA